MQKFFLLFTFSLVFLFTTVTGCQEQQKGNVELKYTYYKGGEVESESEYVKGIRHGYRKFFSEEGKLESVSYYVNGKREGMMKTFYSNGVLNMSVNFVNDQMDGEALSYYPNGKLESKKIFEKGKMVYDAHYTPDGKLEFEDKF